MNIKELFIEVIQNLYTKKNIDYNDTINYLRYIDDILDYLPNIIQLNTLSKKHYQWLNEYKKNNHVIFEEIKYVLMWLEPQNVIYSINKKYPVSKHVIEDWAGHYISQSSVILGVRLYNQKKKYHPLKILKGEYPYYNISGPPVFPQYEEQVKRFFFRNGLCHSRYKNIPKQIILHKRQDGGIISNGKKVTQDVLDDYDKRPYMYKMYNHLYIEEK